MERSAPSSKIHGFNDHFPGNDGYGSDILDAMGIQVAATLSNTYQDVFDTILLHYTED